MRGYYGFMTGLAIVLMARGAVAEPNLPKVKTAGVQTTSLTTPQPVVRTATVRTASVTTAVQNPDVGLNGVTKQVQDYFNDLSTLQANFTQTVTGETTPSQGVFSLRRPGQFLWQYNTPVKQKIISTGSAVYFVDDRNAVTQLPLNAGVARLFNSKTLNLSQQGLRAVRVQSNPHLLVVEFAVDKKIATSDQAGLVSLRLAFDRLPGNNLMLKQIDALDTLSVTTRVEFTNVRENVPLPAKMFQFTPGVYDQRN